MTERSEMDVESLLRTNLSGARPPRAVHDRIVAGVRTRSTGQGTGRVRRWRLAAVAAGVGIGGLAIVWALFPFGNVPAGVVVPVAGFVHTSAQGPAQYALGAHRIAAATGTTVVFERTAPDHVVLAQSSGSITCEVSPLARQGEFVVCTPHGQVRVVGTIFSVAIGGECTHVTVQRGSVWLSSGTSERVVSAGQAGELCAPPAETATASPVDKDDGREAIHEALVLISRGNEPARAAALLERYLQDYPGGLFEEDALFHLCIVKHTAGQHPQARELAARFWKTFPQSRRSKELHQLVDPPDGRPIVR
jgi:ferric-dicitrate binding protein FerR (iron transport regulator)